MDTFTCIDCETEHPIQKTGGTGYATIAGPAGGKICYECCARRDIDHMRSRGKITLYFDGSIVSNWPGTLKIHPTRIKKNNPLDYTVYFTFGGANWIGRNTGDSQLCHCRRLKGRA